MVAVPTCVQGLSSIILDLSVIENLLNSDFNVDIVNDITDHKLATLALHFNHSAPFLEEVMWVLDLERGDDAGVIFHLPQQFSHFSDIFYRRDTEMHCLISKL